MKISDILIESADFSKKKIRKSTPIRKEYGGGYTEIIYVENSDGKIDDYEVNYVDNQDNKLVGHERKNGTRRWFDEENGRPGGKIISEKISDQTVQNHFEQAVLPYLEQHYRVHHERLVRAQDDREDRTMNVIKHPRLKEDSNALSGAKAELKPMMDFFSNHIIPNLKNPTLSEEITDDAVAKIEDLFKNK